MFLLEKEFLLRTDHSPLRNLFSRNLLPTNRVERWILRLSEYNFWNEYQRGQDNVIADVLSRLLFATAEKRRANSMSAAKLNSNLQTSANKYCKPDGSNLKLDDLKLNNNLECE